MQTVTSSDGTKIAFERSGSGPSLVLVHGTSASHVRWGNIRPLLELHFTILAVDRRGRGDSGDGQGDYRLDNEFADIAAVVQAAAPPVILFGHSYGGIAALGALGLGVEPAALIIYEAPVLGASGPPIEVLDRLDLAMTQDDREGVLEIFCKEVVRMRPGDVTALRASPAWPARLAAAHTIPRELRTIETFALEAIHPDRIPVPTLLLHGSDSPDFLKDSMTRLAELVPHAKSVSLAGQQHVAMDTAPQLLNDAIVDFWRNVVER